MENLFFGKEEIPTAHLVNKNGNEFKTIQEEFYNPGNIPACNPENTCEVIQDFLEEQIDELEIIKNQFDLAFKDRKRLLTIREFVVQQLKDIDADLEVVKNTIEEFNQVYLEYKKTK